VRCGPATRATASAPTQQQGPGESLADCHSQAADHHLPEGTVIDPSDAPPCAHPMHHKGTHLTGDVLGTVPRNRTAAQKTQEYQQMLSEGHALDLWRHQNEEVCTRANILSARTHCSKLSSKAPLQGSQNLHQVPIDALMHACIGCLTCYKHALQHGPQCYNAWGVLGTVPLPYGTCCLKGMCWLYGGTRTRRFACRPTYCALALTVASYVPKHLCKEPKTWTRYQSKP
jgi:hypothetical protein